MKTRIIQAAVAIVLAVTFIALSRVIDPSGDYDAGMMLGYIMMILLASGLFDSRRK